MAEGVIVAVFPSRKTLMRALTHLHENTIVEIKRAAVVAKAKNGETVVLDDDISPDEGGIAGGALGALMTALGLIQMGALALPGIGTVIAIGTGALVGGLVGNLTGRFAANLLDFGFKNEQIEALADRLEAGHPALVLKLDDADSGLRVLERELNAFNAELIAPLQVASRKAPPPDIE
jgi:uncharacterized membrane protein